MAKLTKTQKEEMKQEKEFKAWRKSIHDNVEANPNLASILIGEVLDGIADHNNKMAQVYIMLSGVADSLLHLILDTEMSNKVKKGHIDKVLELLSVDVTKPTAIRTLFIETYGPKKDKN